MGKTTGSERRYENAKVQDNHLDGCKGRTMGGGKVSADIVFPEAIKFRVDKDVGYVGRLVNGIINISLCCASLLAAFLCIVSPRSDPSEIPLPIIYAKS